MRRERSALVLALLTTLACGREEAREGESQGLKRDVQVVVAKVGDEVVGQQQASCLHARTQRFAERDRHRHGLVARVE